MGSRRASRLPMSTRLCMKDEQMYMLMLLSIEESTEKRRQRNGHEFNLLPPLVDCVSPLA